MIAKNTGDWSQSDKRYGWKFGCDGFVNASGAAEILGLHPSHVCKLLRKLERLKVKKPTDSTWPLRAGKPDSGLGSRQDWSVCVRSVHEYAKRRKPVEV